MKGEIVRDVVAQVAAAYITYVIIPEIQNLQQNLP
jgi:hypothetical protein